MLGGLLIYLTSALWSCTGTWVNPVTNVAWNCVFPISISGALLGTDSDTPKEDVGLICCCKKGAVPLVGVPIGFWEPALLVDVTRHPLCFVGLNGLNLSKTIKGFGPYLHVEGKNAFYHTHIYRYPLFAILGILGNVGCYTERELEIVYLSEFDMTWHDDVLARFLEEDSQMLGSPVMQTSCAADCLAANSGLPIDRMYWCGGCLGSIFPLTGTIVGVGSDVQASALVVHRALFKMHRIGLLKGTVGKDGLCEAYAMHQMRKQQYKLQMVFPVSQNHACQPLGRSEMLWGQGRSFPVKGEDFCYLVWRRRDCCVLGAPQLQSGHKTP